MSSESSGSSDSIESIDSTESRESTFGDETCPCANSVSLLHFNCTVHFEYSQLTAIDEPEAGAPPLLATATEGRPDKGLTLTLRLVPHPGVPRHLWAGPTKEPEAGVPPLFATATEGRPGEGLTHTLRPIPVQTHLGRISNGFDNSQQLKSPCRCTNSIKMNWHPHSK